WHIGEGITDGGQGRLGTALPIGKTKIPILNVMAATMPFICPGKDECPGTACRKDRANLPIEDVRLDILTIPATVEPDLPHEYRPVPSHILQTCEIGLKTLLRLQVDVETHEVQEWELQILCGGIVHIGDEPFRILLLGSPV